MGFLNRLQRVTVGRIESFLATVEDPEVLFPQLVKEMEDRIRSATETEAKAMATVKAAEREAADLRKKIERFQKGAELAMSQGDEVTAREAVAAQIDAESQMALKAEALARAQKALEMAREARKQMQPQLDELRTKKDEILTRARVMKNQKKVIQTVSGPVSSAKSILDEASRMEAKVNETEAELDVQREISGGKGGPSLESRLKNLEKTASVEERLAALKKKSASSPKK